MTLFLYLSKRVLNSNNQKVQKKVQCYSLKVASNKQFLLDQSKINPIHLSKMGQLDAISNWHQAKLCQSPIQEKNSSIVCYSYSQTTSNWITDSPVENGDYKGSPIKEEQSKNFPKISIECKQSLILNNRSFYSSFYLGAFSPGQSLTIANALRRTLLSELTGFAITHVEIEGVTHEYSNITGVKDTVFDILLNLKEIVIQASGLQSSIQGSRHKLPTTVGSRLDAMPRHPASLDGTEDGDLGSIKDGSKQLKIDHDNTTILPIATKHQEKKSKIAFEGGEAYLQVRGPGVIRACDLKMPPFLVCVDPEQYIATLSEDGVLNMKIFISSGLNQNGWGIQENIELGLSKMSHNKVMAPSNLTTHYATAQSGYGSKSLFKKVVHQGQEQNKAFFNRVREPSSMRAKLTNSVDRYGNLLFLDPVFMPVTKVNYIIEQNPEDFSTQIIILEIWTNGSIHPKKALHEAIKKLLQVLSGCANALS